MEKAAITTWQIFLVGTQQASSIKKTNTKRNKTNKHTNKQTNRTQQASSIEKTNLPYTNLWSGKDKKKVIIS